MLNKAFARRSFHRASTTPHSPIRGPQMLFPEASWSPSPLFALTESPACRKGYGSPLPESAACFALNLVGTPMRETMLRRIRSNCMKRRFPSVCKSAGGCGSKPYHSADVSTTKCRSMKLRYLTSVRHCSRNAGPFPRLVELLSDSPHV